MTTLEPSTLLALFGTEFRRLEAELPEVAAQIRQTMAKRLEPTGDALSA